ncbi:MAG: hypothetical protein NT069_17110 [Planctomycetota bacterium]|nr:hypothetical protein [Planctomycetota bacterium]
MNDFAKKSGADSDDPWEDLAEQLFGTTPGKEHTAAQNTGGSGTAGGSKSSAQVPPFNELEAILTGEKPVPTAEPAKKKSLADLLFDEPEEEPAPVFEEEDEAPPPAKAKRTKRVAPAADLESSEPERTDLRSPQPKPATGSSPQDSYWDALANWNWDDSSGSSQSASPAAEETPPVEPEVSDRSPAPSRTQSGGRSHSGGRPQSGRGGESRGGDKGPRGRGRKDDRSAKGDRPRERPEEVREAPRAAREVEARDERPAPREVVKEDVAPIWDFDTPSHNRLLLLQWSVPRTTARKRTVTTKRRVTIRNRVVADAVAAVGPKTKRQVPRRLVRVPVPRRVPSRKKSMFRAATGMSRKKNFPTFPPPRPALPSRLVPKIGGAIARAAKGVAVPVSPNDARRKVASRKVAGDRAATIAVVILADPNLPRQRPLAKRPVLNVASDVVPVMSRALSPTTVPLVETSRPKWMWTTRRIPLAVGAVAIDAIAVAGRTPPVRKTGARPISNRSKTAWASTMKIPKMAPTAHLTKTKVPNRLSTSTMFQAGKRRSRTC